MRYILIYFILFSQAFNLFSQDIIINGKIENIDKELVKNVRIVYGIKKDNYTVSNNNGNYSFKIPYNKIDSIYFFHSKYERKNIKIDSKLKRKIKNNNLTINIILIDRVLPEIIVEVSEPDFFYGNPIYSISDFEILKDSSILLLTYNKSLKKNSVLRLLNSNKEEIDTFSINQRSVELNTDYRDNIHLITDKSVFYISIKNSKIKLIKENKKHYFKYISSIIDTNELNIYYSNFSEIYPAFSYYQFNKIDSIYTNVIDIIDEPTMEHYRAEYKFSDVRTKLWAHNKQIETGIDKEVWVGASVYSNSIYYKPLYAPLFIKYDTVLIFDHYKNILFKYDKYLNKIDSISINYHHKSRASGWQQPLIQDRYKKVIYAVFYKNGYTYLSLLNLNTGQIIFNKRLFYKYIEKIKVINNNIYYIYRPYESIQKKYIYNEKIKF